MINSYLLWWTLSPTWNAASHFQLPFHSNAARPVTSAFGNNESCKSLAEPYTDIRVKSSCWLFNVVGDSGSGSNLARNPMKVFVFMKKEKTIDDGSLQATKMDTHTHVSENKVNPAVSAMTGMRDTAGFLTLFRLFSSPFTTRAFVVESCVSCSFRHFIVLLNIVTHPAESDSAWCTSTLIRVPRKLSQLTHFLDC